MGPASTLKKSWEVDLKQTFTDMEWKIILRNSKRMSRELRTRLVQFKIINRVYWTPSRLYRDSPTCWRCEDDHGTLLNFLWECPKIQTFWGAIHENMRQITGQDIPYTPSLYVLGDQSPLSTLPAPLADWTCMVLSAWNCSSTGETVLKD